MSENLLEVVRIKDPDNGALRNATRAEAERIKAEVLDAPTHDERSGLPIPPQPTPGKPRTDKAGQPVQTTKKES